VQNELGADSVVVTVFSDDNKKYLSTSLLSSEPVKSDYLTPDVELVGLKAINRVCRTCLGDERPRERSCDAIH
jgi:cysteine synthase A